MRRESKVPTLKNFAKFEPVLPMQLLQTTSVFCIDLLVRWYLFQTVSYGSFKALNRWLAVRVFPLNAQVQNNCLSLVIWRFVFWDLRLYTELKSIQVWLNTLGNQNLFLHLNINKYFSYNYLGFWGFGVLGFRV